MTTKKTGTKKKTPADRKKQIKGRRKIGKKNSKPFAGVVKVSTGSGPSAGEIGASLVEMFNRGEFKAIEDKWWSPKVISVEGVGMAWHGRKAVEGKNAQWLSEHEIIAASAEGPYVGASGFGVKFRMEILEKASGNRSTLEEIGVYTVMNGKILREEFMYARM